MQGSLEDLDRKAFSGSYQCGPILQFIENLVPSYTDPSSDPRRFQSTLFCGDSLGVEVFDYRLIGITLIGLKNYHFLILNSNLGLYTMH